MLGDLPDHGLAIGVRHPVPRLDPPVARDRLLEVPLKLSGAWLVSRLESSGLLINRSFGQ